MTGQEKVIGMNGGYVLDTKLVLVLYLMLVLVL